MFGFFFPKGPVFNFEDAEKSDTAKFARFFRGMLEEGKKRKGKTAASGTISSPEAAAETPAKKGADADGASGSTSRTKVSTKEPSVEKAAMKLTQKVSMSMSINSVPFLVLGANGIDSSEALPDVNPGHSSNHDPPFFEGEVDDSARGIRNALALHLSR
ncbi:hypothetical protein RJ640_001106, partial [Escallonia rubra]